MSIRTNFLYLLISLAASACDPDINTSPPQPQQPAQPVEPGTSLGTLTKAAYTFHQPSGNRVVQGRGNITDVALDVELQGRPVWLAAIEATEFIYWVVALENGRLEAFQLRPDFVVTPIGLNEDKLLPGMPPTLALETNERPLVVNRKDDEAAVGTGPLVLTSGTIVELDREGNVLFGRGDELQTLAIDALPDARLVVNQEEELAILTSPTDIYAHGVLGDAVEARAITIVATKSGPRLTNRIQMPDSAVIEGTSPIWVDIDEDDTEELLVTLSNNPEGDGAKLVVFEKNGERLAEGPLSPGGWRHQLAVYRQAPGEPMYIVDCQKPHVQRIINFYELVGNQLIIRASKTGYSTHILGRRNLDMALAGDFDGDGVKELLAPSTNGFEVRSIVLKNETLLETTPLTIGGKIATNLAAAELEGTLILGVGTENNTLRIWID